MNKKGNLIASKMGFYIVFVLLFTLAIGYSLKFIEGREINKIDFLELEDSVVMNRVVNCLSKGSFGDIDSLKFDGYYLRNCLSNDNYGFLIELNGEEDLVYGLGELSSNSRYVERFVIYEGKEARLKVRYSKNVAV
jgi:hypothetical protein